MHSGCTLLLSRPQQKVRGSYWVSYFALENELLAPPQVVGNEDLDRGGRIDRHMEDDDEGWNGSEEGRQEGVGGVGEVVAAEKTVNIQHVSSGNESDEGEGVDQEWQGSDDQEGRK